MYDFDRIIINTIAHDIKVMTSGAFTAAYLELIPLPPEVQKASVFSAGVAAHTTDPGLAHTVIKFLASHGAARTITKSGLEPIGNR